MSSPVFYIILIHGIKLVIGVPQQTYYASERSPEEGISHASPVNTGDYGFLESRIFTKLSDRGPVDSRIIDLLLETERLPKSESDEYVLVLENGDQQATNIKTPPVQPAALQAEGVDTNPNMQSYEALKQLMESTNDVPEEGDGKREHDYDAADYQSLKDYNSLYSNKNYHVIDLILPDPRFNVRQRPAPSFPLEQSGGAANAAAQTPDKAILFDNEKHVAVVKEETAKLDKFAVDNFQVLVEEDTEPRMPQLLDLLVEDAPQGAPVTTPVQISPPEPTSTFKPLSSEDIMPMPPGYEPLLNLNARTLESSAPNSDNLKSIKDINKNMAKTSTQNVQSGESSKNEGGVSAQSVPKDESNYRNSSENPKIITTAVSRPANYKPIAEHNVSKPNDATNRTIQNQSIYESLSSLQVHPIVIDTAASHVQHVPVLHIPLESNIDDDFYDPGSDIQPVIVPPTDAIHYKKRMQDKAQLGTIKSVIQPPPTSPGDVLPQPTNIVEEKINEASTATHVESTQSSNLVLQQHTDPNDNISVVVEIPEGFQLQDYQSNNLFSVDAAVAQSSVEGNQLAHTGASPLVLKQPISSDQQAISSDATTESEQVEQNFGNQVEPLLENPSTPRQAFNIRVPKFEKQDISFGRPTLQQLSLTAQEESAGLDLEVQKFEAPINEDTAQQVPIVSPNRIAHVAAVVDEDLFENQDFIDSINNIDATNRIGPIITQTVRGRTPQIIDDRLILPPISVNGHSFVNSSGRRQQCIFSSVNRHLDCYWGREPTEWCQTDRTTRWMREGCHCDQRVGACIIERTQGQQRQYAYCAPATNYQCPIPNGLFWTDQFGNRWSRKQRKT